VSVELRDTEWPSYLQATRYSRNGWNISIEYEYAAEVPVKGRADFGNAVVTLGELVPGTYTIEARLFRMADPSVAALVVTQQLVVAPPSGWGVYLVPARAAGLRAHRRADLERRLFRAGSMRTSVNGNVVRVDFAYIGNAGVGGPDPSGHRGAGRGASFRPSLPAITWSRDGDRTSGASSPSATSCGNSRSPPWCR
jgi:hypothetical protein